MIWPWSRGRVVEYVGPQRSRIVVNVKVLSHEPSGRSDCLKVYLDFGAARLGPPFPCEIPRSEAHRLPVGHSVMFCLEG